MPDNEELARLGLHERMDAIEASIKALDKKLNVILRNQRDARP